MAPQRKLLYYLTCMIPMAGLASVLLLRLVQRRGMLPKISVPWLERMAGRPSALVPVMIVVPLILASSVALCVPFLVMRGMILFTPFVLIALATGLAALTRLPRRAGLTAFLALFGPLLWVNYSSVVMARTDPGGPDYGRMAARWTPHIRESDLIRVRRHWGTTPLFYYMNGRDFHFVGHNHRKEILSQPGARLWLLRIFGISPTEEMKQTVSGYEHEQTVRARLIEADLYTPLTRSRIRQ